MEAPRRPVLRRRAVAPGDGRRRRPARRAGAGRGGVRVSPPPAAMTGPGQRPPVGAGLRPGPGEHPRRLRRDRARASTTSSSTCSGATDGSAGRSHHDPVDVTHPPGVLGVRRGARPAGAVAAGPGRTSTSSSRDEAYAVAGRRRAAAVAVERLGTDDLLVTTLRRRRGARGARLGRRRGPRAAGRPLARPAVRRTAVAATQVTGAPSELLAARLRYQRLPRQRRGRPPLAGPARGARRSPRRRDLPLLVWTVDTRGALRYWLRPGRAWLVTTNHPGLALQVRPASPVMHLRHVGAEVLVAGDVSGRPCCPEVLDHRRHRLEASSDRSESWKTLRCSRWSRRRPGGVMPTIRVVLCP